MGHDSWSRIQATFKAGNDEGFFAVQSAAPSIVTEHGYFGMAIADPSKDRDIAVHFVSLMKRFAAISNRVVTSYDRESKCWILKFRFFSNEEGKEIAGKEQNFRYNDKVYTAAPHSLRKIEQRQNTFVRVSQGDLTLFDNDHIGEIRVINTDEVFVRYLVTDKNEIFVCYKARASRKEGLFTDERWSAYRIDDSGVKSDTLILDVMNSSHIAADQFMMRASGLNSKNPDDAASENRIGKFIKPLEKLSPINAVMRECVGIHRGEKNKESFPRFGTGCLPRGIEALKTGRRLADEDIKHLPRPLTKDQAFWDNVSLDKRLEQEYKEKQTGMSKSGNNPRQKKEDLRARAEKVVEI